MAASMDDLLQEIRRLREDVQRLQQQTVYVPWAPYPYAPWVQPYPYQVWPQVIYSQPPQYPKPMVTWSAATYTLDHQK